jgi:hypothetical protein
VQVHFDLPVRAPVFWYQDPGTNDKPVNKKTPDFDPEAIEYMESLGYIN